MEANLTAFSFCYAPPASSEYTINSSSLPDSSSSCEAIMAELRDTCNSVMDRRRCQIALAAAPDATLSIKPHAQLVDTPTDYNLTLTGPLSTVMSARGELLLQCPLKIVITIKIPYHDCPPSTVLRLQCDKIESDTDTVITITMPSARHSSLASEKNVTLTITGTPDRAEYARVRLLVALDEQANLHSDIVRVPLKLHNLICGRKRAGLLAILEETATSIYFPSPFADLSMMESVMETAAVSDGGSTPLLEEPSPPIYITGEPSKVARVKDMLTKLAVQKAKSMYHKNATLHSRKLDWTLLHRRDELRKIMHDNGSFIAFPKMGSNENNVTVYAENRVNVERTLRSLNFLACSIYEACFYFNNRDSAIYGSDGSAHTFFNSISNLTGLVSQLSQVSGAEVMYKSDPGCIQVFGTERAVRNVYQRLHEMPFLKMFHQDTVFNVELSNDQREFISGKKSGKINKIMKTSGAKIKFVPFSDYNFIIEVESTSFTKALDGLTLLQEELPAEISFHVPEAYHKRIIGVGGKNIQRIMKKYGVYVKFSNAEEFASLGGYYDNEDNVVARTPMKNQINLDNLRHAVMELINPRDKDSVTQPVSVPFRMHRVLLRDHSGYLAEITKKTNTRVIWPDHELASNVVTLVGPESQVDPAAHMLKSIIPDTYELHVPRSSALTGILCSDAFHSAVVQRLDKEFGIKVDVRVAPSPPPSTSSSSPSTTSTATTAATTATVPLEESGPSVNTSMSPSRSTPPPSSSPTLLDDADFIIPLRLNMDNTDSLPAALDILNNYLRERHITLYDHLPRKPNKTVSTPSRRATTTSLVDSFSPFGSKILPSVLDSGNRDHEQRWTNQTDPDTSVPQKLHHHTSFSSYSLFDFPPSAGHHHTPFDASWTNFRDMNSPGTAENIRAIFDSPIRPSAPDEAVLPKHRVSMPAIGSHSKTGMGGYRPVAHVPSHTAASVSSGLGGNHLDIWFNQPFMNHHHHPSHSQQTNCSFHLGLGNQTSHVSSAPGLAFDVPDNKNP